MDHEDVVVPGARDVRGTLDSPGGTVDAAVVACPPHPEYGGDRSDRRLRAVAEALADAGVATLRFDYGPWDDGDGERDDVDAAVDWARDRYDRVGLFGYSFGAAMALLSAAGREGRQRDLAAVSALAPGARAADAVAEVPAPLQVLYGSRDDTVDWEPVVKAASRRDAEGHDVRVVEYGADHHFVGQHDKVAEDVAGFQVERLRS